MRGRFTFTGPHVVAAGYEARNVRVTGTLAGRRIELDGRAVAYGGIGDRQGVHRHAVRTGAGRLRPRGQRQRRESSQPARIDRCAARDDQPLARRVITCAAPGANVEGNATLNRSTVEGGIVEDGTIAEFAVRPGTISYSSRGSVSDLDLERVGRAFNVTALAKPEYASRISATFDVKGSLPRTPAGRRESDSSLAQMTIDATGMLKNSEILGGTLPELGFEAHLANGTLSGRADGRFEHFDPAG